jgi:hypothetical protein
MTRNGVKKMCEGWVIFIDHEAYAKFFDVRNGGQLMSNAIAKRGNRHAPGG